MARIARVVARGLPHHITQRGNRRQATFFNNDLINTSNGDILDNISLTTSQDIGKSLAFSPNGVYFLVGTMRGVILKFGIEKHNSR
jgi:REP element-mobilizing transposase RayT